MTNATKSTDKFRAALVLAATLGTIAFNWLSATGSIAGVTPSQVSMHYPTPITPAGYAFTIWSLIYVGLLFFSIYQMFPGNLERFRGVRSLYILACALNCSWIYMWHNDQIAVCFAVILLLATVLLLVNLDLRSAGSLTDYWVAKAPFQLYFGWVTAASVINLFVLLVYLQIDLAANASTMIAVVLILLAALLGVLVRWRLGAHLYPLAIAWALTAIAVKQSGQTLIVVACAIGVVACLIAAASFVVNLPSSTTRTEPRA